MDASNPGCACRSQPAAKKTRIRLLSDLSKRDVLSNVTILCKIPPHLLIYRYTFFFLNKQQIYLTIFISSGLKLD